MKTLITLPLKLILLPVIIILGLAVIMEKSRQCIRTGSSDR